jgi:hypothetical protein
MGCTDEKSVSNRPLKKTSRNANINHNNNINDKDLKNQEKVNHSKDEDIKEISKHIETEQEQNTIKLMNDIENDNKKKEPPKESINNNIIPLKNNNNSQINKKEEEDSSDKEEEEEKDEEKDEEKEEEEEEEEEDYDNEDESNREMIRQIAPYLQSKVNPNFNFPEVKDNVFVGKGLRKMKGYISIVSKEELEKRRNAFWGTRVEGDPLIWNFLKELCDLPEGEEDNMKAMLEANEMTPLKKCINVTYDKSGEVYEIPNYCINEPVKFDLPESHVKKPEKKNLSFHIRKGAQQIKIKASNYTPVSKLKINIGKKFETDAKNVRLFYRGKELKNENELWVYNIEEDCVVMVMCTG